MSPMITLSDGQKIHVLEPILNKMFEQKKLGKHNGLCNDEPFKFQMKNGIRCQKIIDHEEDHFYESKDATYWWEDEGGVCGAIKGLHKLYKIEETE